MHLAKLATEKMENNEYTIPFPLLIIVTILLLILGFLVLLILQKHKLNLPPGKFGWPIIGETIRFLRLIKTGNMDRFIADRTNGYSFKLFKTSLFGERMSVICDPSANKFVFSNENKLVRSCLPGSIWKLLNQGTHTDNQVTFFRMQRSLFSDFLKPDAVQKYVEGMDYMTKQHMDTQWAPNSTITVYPLAKRLAFSISSCLFVGIHDPVQVHSLEHQFELVCDGIISIPISLPGMAYGRALKAAKLMGTVFREIVQSRRRKDLSQRSVNDDSKIFPSNLMSYLASTVDDEGNLLSESDIAKMMIGILIASHETSSSLLTNIVYYLADHRHVYDLALQEQIEIKSSMGDEKLLTWEDTKKMKYCRHIINEVLRIAPPGFAAFREAIHDISYEGFTIPRGWKIFIAFPATHKNPKYFPEPDKFDPTRFEGSGPVPYSFTPFGGGPRMCLGNEFARQEALVFMHNLLINFKWEKLIPNEKIVLLPNSVPEKGLPINLQNRGSIGAA